MRVKTLLNRVQKYKSFVYTDVKQLMEKGRLVLVVQIVPRLNNQPKCSRCGQPGPGYDTLKPRRFEFVPLWGILVSFVYHMRRVSCPNGGWLLCSNRRNYVSRMGRAEGAVITKKKNLVGIKDLK